jgi:hypothetical protein
MGSWGNTDDAANSVLYAVNQYRKTANTTNQTNFFGNTTANAFISGVTVGQFGVAAGEQQAARAGGKPRAAHAGWNVRTEGSGGRAGRVSFETLVAMKTITGDAEDVITPDYTIVINTQPANDSANASADEQAVFTVVASSVPTGATLGYQWTYANGAAVGAGHTGATTASLTVDANTAVDGTAYKVAVSTAGATTVTSANAVITVTV